MQGSFLAGFGLSKAALPSAVAFSPRKLRGAALTGAYSAQSVHALLDGLFSGRVHTTRFQVRVGSPPGLGRCWMLGCSSLRCNRDAQGRCSEVSWSLQE